MLIPRSIQCRIIAALLREKLPEGFTLEQLERMYRAFDEPWQGYLGALLDAMVLPPGVGRSSFITAYVHISPEHREMVDEEAARSAHIPSLEELTLPEIEWLWPGWIPRGMVTLLGAMPSAGKSYVALDLARRVIKGTRFPDGVPAPGPGQVLYVDAENLPQIHDRRARAWGMDRSRLFILGPDDNRLMIDLAGGYDRDRLLEWAWTVRPALVVVDSLSAVSSRGENSVEDVRGIFAFLNRVALDYNCGLMVVHHLRKPGAQLPAGQALTFHDLRGSSHITAMSRSIVGLHWVQTGPRPDLNDPRRMQVIKTNLCRYPEALGVTFRTMEADAQVAEVIYGEAPQPYRESNKTDECADWLRELLKEHGAILSKEVVERGKGAGFSQATVYRARRQLGDQVVADGRGRNRSGNQWSLAEEEVGDM